MLTLKYFTPCSSVSIVIGTLFWRTLINTVKVCKPRTKLTTKYFHTEVQLDLSCAQFTHKPCVQIEYAPYGVSLRDGALIMWEGEPEGFCGGREIFQAYIDGSLSIFQKF